MRITQSNQPITITVVGAGHRADQYLEAMQKFFPGSFKITSVFDPSPVRLNYFNQKYGVDVMNEGGYQAFIKIEERLSDLVIIGTNDDMHYLPAKHALNMGYDILLEKPISQRLEEVLELKDLQKENQFVAVCHVLRHSPFFVKLKEIIDSGKIGKIVNIQHNENIGYFHFVHSYVRGNWRNNEVAAPLIVAKSCHDLDILLYLTNKHCKRISSMGSLSFFNHKHFDEKKMGKRCTSCSIEAACPFSAIKIYGAGIFEWMPFDTENKETLYKQLNESPYGRCVFASDNDVVDHQVSIIEFDDGVTATFNLSAFTNSVTRTIKIMGEYGEILANTDVKDIIVNVWGQKSETVKIETTLVGGHDGADEGMIINLMDAYLHGRPFESTLKDSIESHVMAFKAEESRVENGKVKNISRLMKF